MRSQKPASKLAGRKAAASCRTPKLRTPIYTLEGAKLVARTPVFGVRGFSPDSRFPISRLPHVFHICAIGETKAADPKCGGPRYEFSASTSQPPWMGAFPPTLAFQFHDCRTFSTFALLARQEPRTPKTGVRATNLVLRHRSLHGWELFPRLSLSNFTTAARFPHLRYWRDKSRGPQMRGSALRV